MSTTTQPNRTEHTRTGDQNISHRREFDFPAVLVHRAHTERDLFVQWLGPRGTTVRLDRFDPVTGGAFRYVVEAADGQQWAFRGSYHDVSPGQIVHTWEFEGEPGATLEHLQFIDLHDGRSALEVVSTYRSKAACDAMLASGMDAGMDEDFDRLEELLAAGGAVPPE
jgi:uncharacterized protein YndB with AHSA1/START domain